MLVAAGLAARKAHIVWRAKSKERPRLCASEEFRRGADPVGRSRLLSIIARPGVRSGRRISVGGANPIFGRGECVIWQVAEQAERYRAVTSAVFALCGHCIWWLCRAPGHIPCCMVKCEIWRNVKQSSLGAYRICRPAEVGAESLH